jgi:hypothetical protein
VLYKYLVGVAKEETPLFLFLLSAQDLRSTAMLALSCESLQCVGFAYRIRLFRACTLNLNKMICLRQTHSLLVYAKRYIPNIGQYMSHRSYITVSLG